MKVPELGVKYFIWCKSNKKNYGELVSDILNKKGFHKEILLFVQYYGGTTESSEFGFQPTDEVT